MIYISFKNHLQKNDLNILKFIFCDVIGLDSSRLVFKYSITLN